MSHEETDLIVHVTFYVLIVYFIGLITGLML